MSLTFVRQSGPFALARALAWLRLCAIAGQSTAVLVCAEWLQFRLPVPALASGIGLLALFAAFASWRLRQPWPLSEWETICHIGVDTAVLGYLLYLTGGATNPFITLLLIPIALSAAALSVRAILMVSALVGIAYALLLHWSMPLPVPLHVEFYGRYTLHIVGMVVNFVITAVLLGFFINRLAHALRVQQSEVQRVRERALRDEGILAIATQAAGAAHELNTPLSTMRTLLPELCRERAGDVALVEDLTLLSGQVDRCRTILREMVAFGKAQLSQVPERLSTSAFIHSCVQRFELLRPDAELTVELDPDAASIMLRTPPGLRHALINLLNNAAEASATHDSHVVILQVTRDGAWLQICVRDHGPGFGNSKANTRFGHSHKQAGLGLGLALAEATAERLNGELVTDDTANGAEVCLRLPMLAIAEP